MKTLSHKNYDTNCNESIKNQIQIIAAPILAVLLVKLWHIIKRLKQCSNVITKHAFTVRKSIFDLTKIAPHIYTREMTNITK